MTDSIYSRKIEVPIYEPKDKKPLLSSLTSTTKRDQLLLDIEKSDVPEEIKTFLQSAAERHTVFNFGKIADFYAHSKPDVKNLFEQSALVIVDYDDAIKHGFVAYQEVVDSNIDKIQNDGW